MMMPLSIILGAEITRLTPKTPWLGSGTRAMDHGIDALCSPRGNPWVESVCLQGLRYLYDRNTMLSVFTRANPRTIESPEHIVDILIAA
jgi:alcohol dehydrogenase class IV